METTPLVQLEALGGAVPEVRGAIVKVAPMLRASQRDTFNGAQVAAELRGAGALAVQLAPVVVPDTVAPGANQKVAGAASVPETILAYFSEVKGVPEDELAEAQALALKLMEAD